MGAPFASTKLLTVVEAAEAEATRAVVSSLLLSDFITCLFHLQMVEATVVAVEDMAVAEAATVVEVVATEVAAAAAADTVDAVVEEATLAAAEMVNRPHIHDTAR